MSKSKKNRKDIDGQTRQWIINAIANHKASPKLLRIIQNDPNAKAIFIKTIAQLIHANPVLAEGLGGKRLDSKAPLPIHPEPRPKRSKSSAHNHSDNDGNWEELLAAIMGAARRHIVFTKCGADCENVTMPGEDFCFQHRPE